jgi:hypothetical protein
MKEALVFEEKAGRIVVPSQTLASIVSVAVERGGARVRRHPRRSLAFELGAEPPRVEVGIVAPAGAVLPELAARVQSSVYEALELMCEMHELAVDVTVEEIA